MFQLEDEFRLLQLQRHGPLCQVFEAHVILPWQGEHRGELPGLRREARPHGGALPSLSPRLPPLLQGWAKKWALGCVNPASCLIPDTGASSRNLGSTF